MNRHTVQVASLVLCTKWKLIVRIIRLTVVWIIFAFVGKFDVISKHILSTSFPWTHDHRGFRQTNECSTLVFNQKKWLRKTNVLDGVAHIRQTIIYRLGCSYLHWTGGCCLPWTVDRFGPCHPIFFGYTLWLFGGSLCVLCVCDVCGTLLFLIIVGVVGVLSRIFYTRLTHDRLGWTPYWCLLEYWYGICQLFWGVL